MGTTTKKLPTVLAHAVTCLRFSRRLLANVEPGSSHCLNEKRSYMGSSVAEMQLCYVHAPLPCVGEAASPLVQSDNSVPSVHWNMVLVYLEWKKGVVPYFI